MSKNSIKEEAKACSCESKGAVDVFGCRLTLYPMSDDFVDIIMGGISKVDTSKVWSRTSSLDTCYRGKESHVMDCVRGAFISSYKEDVHMTSTMTFSKGCPGDVDADHFLEADDVLINEEIIKGIDFPVTSKISFYCFGRDDYMDHIYKVKDICLDNGLNPKADHYVTTLEGSIIDTFNCFSEIVGYASEHVPHYVLEATLSVNSPTKNQEELTDE